MPLTTAASSSNDDKIERLTVRLASATRTTRCVELALIRRASLSLSQEDELAQMSSDPAARVFCNLAINPMDDDEERLTFMHAGWAGQPRDFGVIPSVIRKVQTFIQMRPAVLHADEVRAHPLDFIPRCADALPRSRVTPAVAPLPPCSLHLSQLINKKAQLEVRYLMMQLIKYRMPIQVRGPPRPV